MAPLLETRISPKIFEDEFQKRSDAGPSTLANDESIVIGNREAVVILNPTKYTMKEDEEEESSLKDIDPDEIHAEQETPLKGKEEVKMGEKENKGGKQESLQIDPFELMPNLKLAYKEP